MSSPRTHPSRRQPGRGEIRATAGRLERIGRLLPDEAQRQIATTVRLLREHADTLAVEDGPPGVAVVASTHSIR